MYVCMYISYLQNLVKRIEKDDKDPLQKLKEKVGGLNLTFNLRTVKEDEVMKVVKKLKNKTSHGFPCIAVHLNKLYLLLLEVKKVSHILCIYRLTLMGVHTKL